VIRDWEKLGLLDGLDNNKKRLCSEAFDDALDYLVQMKEEDELMLTTKTLSVSELIKKKDISMYDIMMVFPAKGEIKINMKAILIPMIRRVISFTNNKMVLSDFLNHCKTQIRIFDSSKYESDVDWELVVATHLSETYKEKQK
jgi:hypothetical protein